MKFLLWLVVALTVLIGLVAVWARIAPVREADWHHDVADPGFPAHSNMAVFCPAPGTRFATAGEPDLERIDEIARNWRRTKRVFGSPEAGLVTYETRSKLMGFPDYTTVGRREGQICIIARQRFGYGDGGVNAHRVAHWAKAYTGLHELPPIAGQLP